MEEVEEDEENTQQFKRPRIEKRCLLCRESSYSQTIKTEEYLKLFTDHFVPPFEKIALNKFKNLDCFEFCTDCENILDELLQLTNALDFLLKNIAVKVKRVKCSILNNGLRLNTTEDNQNVNKFLKILTKDMNPVVNMKKDNMLWREKSMISQNDTFSKISNKTVNSEVVKLEPEDDFGFVNEDIMKFEPWNQPLDGQDDLNFGFDFLSNNLMSDHLSNTSVPQKDCTNIEKSERSDIILKDPLSEPRYENEWSAPNLSWIQMTILAIGNLKDTCGTKDTIFDFIVENFPYYKYNSEYWKNLLCKETYSNVVFRKINGNESRTSSVSDIWTVRELTKETMQNIIEVLESPEIISTMSYPERRTEFVQRLSTVPIVISSHINQLNNAYNKECNASTIQRTPTAVVGPANPNTRGSYVLWQRPPFSLAQIVFIAISNCSGKTATADQIVQRIMSIFPFFAFNNPLKTWQTGLHTTLFVNKCFGRIGDRAIYNINTDNWMISEADSADMRSKINENLASSNLHPTTYLIQPAEILKNALMEDYNYKTSNHSVAVQRNAVLREFLVERVTVNKSTSLQSSQSGSGCSTADVAFNRTIVERWKPPPFNFAQVIFIALWSSPGRQAIITNIIETVRRIFPYSRNPSWKWESRIPAVLFSNPTFIRLNASENEVPNTNHIWTLVNSAVVDFMKFGIEEILRTNSFPPSNYMTIPVHELFKNTVNNCCLPPPPIGNNFGGVNIQNTHVAGAEINRPLSNPTAIMEAENGNKTWPRPPFCFSLLVAFVLSSNGGHPMTCFSICEMLTNYFPYFQSHRQWLSENILSTLRGNKSSYFLQLDHQNENGVLTVFSLNTQRCDLMGNIKLEMYNILKQFSVVLYESFSKPSGLYALLKTIFGEEFDLSFLQSITVYRQAI